MVEQKASDLFFSPGSPLHIKIEGKIQPAHEEFLTAEEVEQLADTMMNEEQREIFATQLEMNLALSLEGLLPPKSKIAVPHCDCNLSALL